MFFVAAHSRISRTGALRGFTLVEMIVSIAIFAIVAVVAVGALVRIVGLNRQAQSMQAAMNNLGFALESMSRDMRTGSNFQCHDYGFGSNTYYSGSPASFPPLPPEYCPISVSPGAFNIRVIMFQSSSMDPNCLVSGVPTPTRLIYAYAFVPKGQDASGQNIWSLQKSQQSVCTDPIRYSSDSSNTFFPLTDETNVTLTDYRFGIYFQPSQYAWAFIRLVGYSGIKVQDQKYFDVQTSVSQRVHD